MYSLSLRERKVKDWDQRLYKAARSPIKGISSDCTWDDRLFEFFSVSIENNMFFGPVLTGSTVFVMFKKTIKGRNTWKTCL